MDENGLAGAMRLLAAGVAVLAARAERGYRGLTVTSLTSVSLDPPLVLVCLDRLAQTRDLVVDGAAFTLSVLTREQDFLADRFSGRAPAVEPAWREVPHRLGAGGLPILEGALAWLECAVESVHPAGDHDIVVGRVLAAGAGGADPLVLWDRGFWTVGS